MLLKTSNVVTEIWKIVQKLRPVSTQTAPIQTVE